MTTPTLTSPRRSAFRVLAPIVAGGFLLFVAGAVVADFRLPPYHLLFQRAFAYAHAVIERHATERGAAAEVKITGPTGRVSIPATAAAFDGYTFLTFGPSRRSTARLIAMDGSVVHEWHKDLRAIWPDPPQRARPSPDSAISWRYAHLFANGDIITTIKSSGDTPDGYGIVKLDKDSNVIWAIPENFHHHFSIAPDGRIFGIEHNWRNTRVRPVDGLPSLPPKVLEDRLVVISTDGKVLSRTSLLELMAAPEHRDLLTSTIFKPYHTNNWDPLHPNDAEYVPASFARMHPEMMKAGDVLLSFRDLDALAIYDPAANKITRTIRGPWVRQHDPDLLPNGHIILFDNRGDDIPDIPGGSTRILEIDPETTNVLWDYHGTAAHPFRSIRSGGEQRLPNGNTLISEDETGRVFEVTRDGTIVWEYRDTSTHHATRVAKDWITFTPQHPRQ